MPARDGQHRGGAARPLTKRVPSWTSQLNVRGMKRGLKLLVAWSSTITSRTFGAFADAPLGASAACPELTAPAAIDARLAMPTSMRTRAADPAAANGREIIRRPAFLAWARRLRERPSSDAVVPVARRV